MTVIPPAISKGAMMIANPRDDALAGGLRRGSTRKEGVSCGTG